MITNMKLGIMQPYFIPYIGYWQLLNVVDKYVIYDDVNYIKGGWINRNRILIEGEPKYFNIQLNGASANKLINEISVSNNQKVIAKNLRILEAAYKKAPYFEDTYKIMEDIFREDETNLAKFLEVVIKNIANYLDIKTEILISSTLDKDNKLKGEEKVISICKLLGAREYYNAIGGENLYSKDAFKKNNINLKFLKSNRIEYKQFGTKFIPNLSIIDVLMFNSKNEIKKMLDSFSVM